MSKTPVWHCFSAPGRICLYGEHQDYLGLTVVPTAINLRTIIGLKSIPEKKVIAQSLDLNIKDSFKLQKSIQFKNNAFDYLRAIIKVLLAEELGTKLPGFKVKIKSSVPIGSGLSSSAALLVAWLTALNEQWNLKLSKQEIALLSFKAENQELGVNCGIMDQYASSLGGIFALDCYGPPFEINRFNKMLDGLIIGDSLIQRAANEPLTLLKGRFFSGQTKLKKNYGYDLQTLTEKQLEKAKTILSKQEEMIISGGIKIRDITKEACLELDKNSWDLCHLGELLTEQHIVLRDLLKVSIPKLDQLVRVAIEAGAYGAKLSGAGFGGCIVALAPGREEEVTTAIQAAGGKAIICKTDEGGRKEETCFWEKDEVSLNGGGYSPTKDSSFIV
ncbi:MAG: hypothetical protein GF308_12830 [Candidatus Heimdallarchaeota archaeon]|nr:hypothetical protein [Candidatus Heimdallarchaeota archaeon]